MSNKNNQKYKNVLLISNVPVSSYSAQGASRGSWFRDWNKDNLAMMSFAPADKADAFAKYLYTIGLSEKIGGDISKRFINSLIDIESGAPKKPTSIGIDKKSNDNSLKKKIKIFLGLFTYPKLSADLKQFLNDFKPDIIFATVADCYGCRLAKFLSRKRDIPYIIQQEDNWLVSDVKNGMFSKFAYRVRKSCLKNTIKQASKRYVICPSMKDYFEAVFDLSFESLFCADEPKRFLPPIKHHPDEQTIFTYIGNSQPGRSPEFVKIAEAIKRSGIKNPAFKIYSTNPFKDDMKKLDEFGFVEFLPIPHHNDVPSVLADSHVLILAESFDKNIIEYTRLALSSKVQIYMMANVPILIFASPETGVMDYALKTGFAHAVTGDNMDKLTKAVSDIVYNKGLREELIKKAFDTGLKNHDADKIRKKLKSTIDGL